MQIEFSHTTDTAHNHQPNQNKIRTRKRERKRESCNKYFLVLLFARKRQMAPHDH